MNAGHGPPVLIAMCGLPFAGKSVLAASLGRELRIAVLSYDADIYPASRHLAPPGSSPAAVNGFLQAIARDRIGASLSAGQSVIYDDLMLARADRRQLAAVADRHQARFVLVYLDTPRPDIERRREQNTRSRARDSVPEFVMDADAALLEPPGEAEQPVRVGGGDVLPEILARVQARL